MYCIDIFVIVNTSAKSLSPISGHPDATGGALLPLGDWNAGRPH